MKITLSDTAGFCFGVRRAVELVEKTAAEGKRVVTLGPIVHNRHVVERFNALGVREAACVAEIPDGATVIIRAHGVGRAVYEALEARGLTVVDATCPFVDRIHKLVRRAEEEGRRPVIFGSRTHPEVVGISGWCDEPLVMESPEEFEAWLREAPERRELPLALAAQTTSNQNQWKKFGEIANLLCTNCKKFDTICEATENRQTAAALLAAKSDAMVVVGDQNSANTRQLAAICRAHCQRVFAVDNAAELADCDFSGIHTIGITAGASTPAWIIKEVNQTMDEIKTVETTATEESFEALLDASIKTLNTGDTVTGTVVAIGTTEVQVDLGTKHAGYIPCDEVSADPNIKPEDVLHVGDEIKVFVVRVNDQEGTVQLSRKKLDGMRVWDELQEAADNKTPVEAKITETNKGGLVANVKGVRVFIPASASGVARGGNLEELKGQTVRIRITEVNRERRGGRVVGSIRAVANEERKAAQEKIWSEIEVGKKYTGTVKSLTSYGAFVDIGGVDGMVHVSELSWRRIKNPAEVVKVGDVIDVFVIGLDPEKHKISLGYKTAEMNPWNQFTAKYSVGDVAKVKIVKMMTFGAFAEIVPGVDGLIHISQIADRRIGKPEDVLSVGQEVDAKIIDIDAENKRISLSIRALLEPTVEEQAQALAEEAAEAVEAE
ncbi:MAG: bifunctional 4-hydroxy-3-methylbut-2-enyl diphosphate reductase/30S ribosomal protein S1 [Oscillospiraceae bacterium]|nr:bifunctional 4-hydroxy-3-methylbut-2-enyl diphosphate reductase/30S ribosomal protein S1 [Oscillospiraceae bacterium]